VLKNELMRGMPEDEVLQGMLKKWIYSGRK
jgi:hypothetical protein